MTDTDTPRDDGGAKLLVQYTLLLRKHKDPNAAEVKAFVAEHADDQQFIGRVETLNELHELKKSR